MSRARPSGSGLIGLALTDPALDRDGVARSRPALFDELWEDSATRVLPLWQGRALLRESGVDGPAASAALALLKVDEVPSALLRVYLGRTIESHANEPAGTPVVALVLTDAAAAQLEPNESRWANLRQSASTLDGRDAAIFVEALAITNWHAVHTHCPRCGTPTVVEMGGWVRRCFADDSQHFPRTDAAVIVSVRDADDRLLLGSNAMWENNRYSLLAGFVEPGESFEAAAIREIGEEAGVRIADPVYLGSQPWPFPASIMVGMTARLADGQSAEDLLPDGEEILALRWFSREQLWEERESVLLPGSSSIARAITEDWYGGPLDAPPATVVRAAG
jgi:NAD+ diphosphatase